MRRSQCGESIREAPNPGIASRKTPLFPPPTNPIRRSDPEKPTLPAATQQRAQEWHNPLHDPTEKGWLPISREPADMLVSLPWLGRY